MQKTPDKQEWRTWYEAMTEAVERLKARELAGMSDAEGLRQMALLGTPETPWRERPDWSGLVEQQAFFHRKKNQ